jgi:hypothetical protein
MIFEKNSKTGELAFSKSFLLMVPFLMTEKNIFFLNNNNFFKVIEKTEQTLSAEGFFKTLIDLSLDFFQKLCVTFSFECFQTFWTLMLKKTGEMVKVFI